MLLELPRRGEQRQFMRDGFPGWLEQWFERTGTSQRALAHKSTLSTATISRLRSGDLNPKKETVKMLARAFGELVGVEDAADIEASGMLAAGFVPSPNGRSESPPALSTPEGVTTYVVGHLRFYTNGVRLFSLPVEQVLTEKEILDAFDYLGSQGVSTDPARQK